MWKKKDNLCKRKERWTLNIFVFIVNENKTVKTRLSSFCLLIHSRYSMFFIDHHRKCNWWQQTDRQTDIDVRKASFSIADRFIEKKMCACLSIKANHQFFNLLITRKHFCFILLKSCKTVGRLVFIVIWLNSYWWDFKNEMRSIKCDTNMTENGLFQFRI